MWKIDTKESAKAQVSGNIPPLIKWSTGSWCLLISCFLLVPATLAMPRFVPEPGLPEMSLLFVTLKNGVLLEKAKSRSLTPMIAKVDSIKVPGNKQGFYDDDVDDCYILAYGDLNSSYTVSFNRGVLYCRVQAEGYQQAAYIGTTVDYELNTSITPQAIVIDSELQLTTEVTGNIRTLHVLKMLGLSVDTFIADIKTLLVEDMFEKQNSAFQQIPSATRLGILLSQPLVFSRTEN